MVNARLKSLGFNPQTVQNHLDENLTLSYHDGVLFLTDKYSEDPKLLIDFNESRFQYRLQRADHEQVVKACRIKNQTDLTLLDTTCGLGRDAMLLQQSGFKVTACERHPVLAALLADGLSRLSNDQPAFKLLCQDARKILPQVSYDVIYLDPMFDETRKSAKVKKGMQLLQQLHHDQDNDGSALFEAAWQATCQRLVIKRAPKADIISQHKPTFQFKSKACRFDVYQRS